MIDLKIFDGHTPGPWHHDDDFSFIESDDGEILATVRTTAPMNGRDGALIAAAPDLLAEVIRLRAELALNRRPCRCGPEGCSDSACAGRA